MADDLNELDKRIALVEKDMEHLKESIGEMKETQKDSYEILSSLKERLDRQNGLIPHMSENINQISERVDFIISKNSAAQAKVPTASKYKWGAFGAIAVAFIAAIVQIWTLYK